MSLLLDALKEAEKSRKGLKTASKSVSSASEEPVVLDLDLDQTEASKLEEFSPEKPKPEVLPQEEPTKIMGHTASTAVSGSSNAIVAPVTPPSTEQPTLQHHTTKDARVATDVFQNREKSKNQTKLRLPLLLLILLLVFLGFLAMFFFAKNNETSLSTKPFSSIQNTLPQTAQPPEGLASEGGLNKEIFTDNNPALQNKFLQNRSMRSEIQPDTALLQEAQVAEIKSSQVNLSIQTTQQPAALTTDYPNKPTAHKTNNKVPVSGREANRNNLPSGSSSNPDLQITKRQLPDYSLSSLSSASDALKKGHIVSAEQIYRQVLKQFPNNVEAMAGLATAFVQQGLVDEGRGMFYEVLNKDPENLLAKIGLINIQSTGSSNLSAGSQLKQLLVQHPKQADIHASLGSFYARRGEWPSAQASYFEAFSLEPENPDYAFNLAVSLDQIRKPDIAIKYYKQALALVENSPFRFNKADAERRLSELKGLDQLKGITP